MSRERMPNTKKQLGSAGREKKAIPAEESMANQRTRRSALRIMGSLIFLVKPLLLIMIAAIILGTAGYLCAIFLTILAGRVIAGGVISGIAAGDGAFGNGGSGMWFSGVSAQGILTVMIVIAFMRGILHYVEQYCNHFIAFKLLAIIRHKVFAALRKLCPAKLEGRDKGNLISILTTDIELLEVFYAHTISPIAIAVLTSGIMVAFIGHYHVLAGLLALAAYLIVGVLIPLVNGKLGGEEGMAYRTQFGQMNSFVLDSLRGLDETIQYGYGEKRKAQMSDLAIGLADMQDTLNRREGMQRALTTLAILLASYGMLALAIRLFMNGSMDAEGVLICTVAMMGSFGSVTALASLSNNLNQTLASGERVLSLLEETPVVEEIPMPDAAQQPNFLGAAAEHVTFSYEKEVILDDYSVTLQPGKITGIHGASGSGKSTLLKLLMRFWNVQNGAILVGGDNVDQIPTKQLRAMESYVTQETHLFCDSIANNIAIGKMGASKEEIMEAAKKASIHDFILTLPNGYDTQVGELGDTLSGGERQRIGIARAFLHDAPLLLLDEPTSNLDSLNEGIILKSLKETAGKKTVVLVSHRASTMQVADVVYEMEGGRVS